MTPARRRTCPATAARIRPISNCHRFCDVHHSSRRPGGSSSCSPVSAARRLVVELTSRHEHSDFPETKIGLDQLTVSQIAGEVFEFEADVGRAACEVTLTGRQG